MSNLCGSRLSYYTLLLSHTPSCTPCIDNTNIKAKCTDMYIQVMYLHLSLSNPNSTRTYYMTFLSIDSMRCCSPKAIEPAIINWQVISCT